MGTKKKIIRRPRIDNHCVKRAVDRTRRVSYDLKARLEDMAIGGPDAENCFPSLGPWRFGRDAPEAEAASARRLYNDWNAPFLGHRAPQT